MTAALDPGEQRLVDAIAARSDELVALLCELIRFDTTSRADPAAPARDEAALQEHLAARLRAAGAAVEVWEPASGDVAGHPLTPAGGIGFAGRPQLAARFPGSGGGRSLLFNGHIDVVPARREDGWEQDPFDPQVRDGRVTGRGACDMKGGIAAMVLAAEAVAAAGGLAGDLLVCTNTDEESSGVGGLACARHGVAADFAIVTEPSQPRGLAGVPRVGLLRGRAHRAVRPHRAGASRAGATAARSTRSTRRGTCSRASTGCGRTGAAGPAPTIRCSTRPTSSRAGSWPTRAGPSRSPTAPSSRSPRSSSPARPTPTAGRATCSGRSRASCAPGATPTPGSRSTRRASRGTPRSTRPRPPSTPRASRRCSRRTRRSGCRRSLGGLGSWYDGATFALEAGTPALMYGPSSIDRAHTVGEWVPVADLVACAQGLALAASRLCR